MIYYCFLIFSFLFSLINFDFVVLFSLVSFNSADILLQIDGGVEGFVVMLILQNITQIISCSLYWLS